MTESQEATTCKVLVIDGDFSSAKKIAPTFAESGFEMMVALCESAELKIADEHFLNAIVVKDSPLQLDGFKLCQPIRRIFNLLLILLGDKPEIEVYSSRLDVSTDWGYYMQSPINYDELATRIKVLLWRYEKAELRL
jgi:DNA-binding response OmpR family regulator